MSLSKQIQELESALRDPAFSRGEYIHIQAVLLKKKGESLPRVSEITGKSIDAIKQWCAVYHCSGMNSLNLPPYHLEFNPQEHVWKALKQFLATRKQTEQADWDATVETAKSFLKNKLFDYRHR